MQGSGVRLLSKKLLILLPVLPGILVLFLYPGRVERFGTEKFDQLREGMKISEVTSFLGYPPGDYRPALWKNPPWFISPSDKIGYLEQQWGLTLDQLHEMDLQDVEEWVSAGRPIPPSPGRVTRKKWLGRDFCIEVAFDQNGRAIHCSLWRVCPPRAPRDVLNGIRYLLEL